RIFTAVAALILMVLTAGSAFGQTVLNFPRILSSSDLYTGIAVSNPTPQPATITFTAYQGDGSGYAGPNVQNPVIVDLAAGPQQARLFPEIFGSAADFNGWVQATSSSSGLTGFVITGKTTAADFDGSVAPKPLE